MNTPLIAISATPQYEEAAIALAKQSNISLANQLTHQAHFELHLDDDYVLSLHDNNNPKIKPLIIDFIGGKNRHRRLYGGGKGQQLAKALGFNKFSHPTIIDATAGLGRDAFVIASLGGTVTLLERQPAVALLLKNALLRGLQSKEPELLTILQRMTFYTENSTDYIEALDPKDYPDVIYIDPMFPERRKKAKVKKDMQFFHSLVGQDHDAEKLLQIALQCAKKRIVVKRPRTADSLAQLSPAFVFKGQSTRYDIYLPKF
ncbi:MAG: class I SAM-dependent methyltransferase [Thiotrichaceae bacterium]|nr:class I SAM-dependent methyltransferase [Thiotrichaceae bacterium]